MKVGLNIISIGYSGVRTMINCSKILLLLVCCLVLKESSAQIKTEGTPLHLRTSPVSYHTSFDQKEFLDDDIIEQSGKKSLKEREIDFPEGKFGKGIRMNYVRPPLDQSNMSGIDLDLVVAVIFNSRAGNKMGFNEPFIWGSGRVNAMLGAVSFWAKGELPFDSTVLFKQTTISFGREERDMIGIEVDKDHKLSAYVRDARYVRHVLKSDAVWDSSKWNFIVLNWDWANGLEFWLNGQKIASSWKTDGWFAVAPSGLFALTAPKIIYDELYLMDRPLSMSEIKKLMSSNVPPQEESPVYAREKNDLDELEHSARLRQYSGADKSKSLPEVSPGKVVSFKEIWPNSVSDGHVPGWYMIDGRNEMAWPHPIAFFTIIPGDGAFHAEKADIKIPADSRVNYVGLTGNLTNVKVQEWNQDSKVADDVFSVPAGNQFFYGTTIPTTVHRNTMFRIPFTEKYGTPPGFEGKAHLPLSGEKRIQNVAFYHFSVDPGQGYKEKGDRLTLDPHASLHLDDRTLFAINAVTSRDERKIVMALPNTSEEKEKIIDIGAFSRLNIMSQPYNHETGISGVTLSLPIKTVNPEETLFITVRDPAVPSRLWNQFAVKLKGFDKDFKRLILTINFQDIVLTGGDRFWIDLGTAGKTEIKTGNNKNPAQLFIIPVAVYRAVEDYAAKELIPAIAQYSKSYQNIPWQFTGKMVSIEKPYCYGGFFDMILPALAVHRVKPDDFVTNYLIRRVDGPYSETRGSSPKAGLNLGNRDTALVTLTDPLGAPDWAVYMRDYNKKRWAMADWWSKRQNSDGRVGGGWTDDALFGLAGLEDLALDDNQKLLNLTNALHTKFELTDIYRDGYCNISPEDRLHSSQFVSERYNTIVNNMGEAYSIEREMKVAWHLNKPDQTPLNYGGGMPFKSAANALNWYWGKEARDNAYVSKPLKEVTDDLRHSTTIFNKYYFYRLTASNVMHDDYVPFGSINMYSYLLGGPRAPQNGHDVHLKLAVTWPSGGGPNVARVILHADDNSLDGVIYSFESRKRNLKMRLCRINDGRYKVGLYADPKGTGNAGTPIWTTETDINRFDVITLPIPSRKSLVLKVEQIKKYGEPSELADLAIDRWDAIWSNNTVTANIHNIGNKNENEITVGLFNGETLLQEKVIPAIDAPADYIPKVSTIVFSGIPFSVNLRIVIDPDNKKREMLKDNNSAVVVASGSAHQDQILWDIHRNKIDKARHDLQDQMWNKLDGSNFGYFQTEIMNK
jgi:hypothetical protein